MTIITCAMRKGGVGKAASVIMLTGEYVHQGKRVLVVDMDDQCSLTKFLLPDATQPDQLRPRPRQ